MAGKVIRVGWRSFEGWGFPWEAWTQLYDGRWIVRGRHLTRRAARRHAESPTEVAAPGRKASLTMQPDYKDGRVARPTADRIAELEAEVERLREGINQKNRLILDFRSRIYQLEHDAALKREAEQRRAAGKQASDG